MEHKWQEISFVFSSWIECTCGFEPTSQEEFDNHNQQEKTNA